MKNNEKIELEKNKLLLKSGNIIVLISTILFIGSVFISEYCNLENNIKVFVVILGIIIFSISIVMALKIEQIVGYYKCSKCGYEEVPNSWLKISIAPHIGRTRYMKCNKCGKYAWHKKVLTKREEK